MLRTCRSICCFVPAVIVLSGALTDTAADDSLSFSRDVLPILSENCFPCHGPDEEQRQAELRLDDEAEAIDMLNRPAGHDSELLRRIET
ncbi:MAG: c-type cytochrome domain-containing protein, partial [Planctomycetaceae bacterium]